VSLLDIGGRRRGEQSLVEGKKGGARKVCYQGSSQKEGCGKLSPACAPAFEERGKSPLEGRGRGERKRGKKGDHSFLSPLSKRKRGEKRGNQEKGKNRTVLTLAWRKRRKKGGASEQKKIRG